MRTIQFVLKNYYQSFWQKKLISHTEKVIFLVRYKNYEMFGAFFLFPLDSFEYCLHSCKNADYQKIDPSISASSNWTKSNLWHSHPRNNWEIHQYFSHHHSLPIRPSLFSKTCNRPEILGLFGSLILDWLLTSEFLAVQPTAQ